MSEERLSALVVRVNTRAFALPLSSVVETLRALPTEPVVGALPFVRGLSIIRGAATPVLDLGQLLGGPPGGPGGRWVVLRVGTRRVAVMVESVERVAQLERTTLKALPPLLQGASSAAMQAVGELDRELLLVLDASRLLSVEELDALERPKALQ